MKKFLLSIVFILTMASIINAGTLTENDKRRHLGTVKITDEVEFADVTTDGELKINGIIKVDGIVSDDNSTATPLDADGVFTGSSIDILDYGIIFVNVHTDKASATDGLSIQQSSDGTNWDHDDVYTVPANGNKNYSINPFAQFMRVTYTNGSDTQTSFRLQTLLKGNAKPSSHRVQDQIVDEDDAELVKAVLTGKSNGTFTNVLTTVDGDLKISNNSSGLSIAKGDVTGTTFIHKFGNAPDFDTGDGEVTVWDGAEDNVTWELMDYVYSTTADIDSLSSSDVGDTIQIAVQGLDTNYDLVTQTITTAGQSRVALTTDLIRVFRLKNVDSTDAIGHIFCFVNGALTGGIPDTNADIRAIIQPGNNQTEMAVYTVPNGKTGYMRDWYAATAGANRTSNYPIRLLARPFGQVFQLKHKSALADNGTSSYQHNYKEPEVFQAKTDIEMKVSMTASGATEGSVSAGFDIVLIDD